MWGKMLSRMRMPISVPGMGAISWGFRRSLELPLGMGKLDLRQEMECLRNFFVPR